MARQLEQGRRLHAAAKQVNMTPGWGHIAASVLYDCFECLILAAIAHSGEDLPNPYQGGIHTVRVRLFEAKYANQLPAGLNTLRVITNRRNEIRYIEHDDPAAPWELHEYSTAVIAGHMKAMDSFLKGIESLLSRNYLPAP